MKNKVAPPAALNNKTKPAPKDAAPKETMMFSKLVFDDAEISSTSTRALTKDTKSRKSLLAKNPSQALLQLERRQERIEAIRATNPAEAAAMESHDSWARAISRAQGILVHDDPKLLKRALKRRNALKEKAKKKWEEKQEKIKEEQNAKQQRRRDNLEARKAGKPTERAPKGGTKRNPKVFKAPAKKTFKKQKK